MKMSFKRNKITQTDRQTRCRPRFMCARNEERGLGGEEEERGRKRSGRKEGLRRVSTCWLQSTASGDAALYLCVCVCICACRVE